MNLNNRSGQRSRMLSSAHSSLNRILVWPLIALGATFLLLAFYGTEFYTYTESLSLNGDPGTRLQLYEQAWQMIMERPLIGFSGSAFNPAYPLVVSAAGVTLAGGLHSFVNFSLEMEGAAIVFAMVIAAGFAKAPPPRTEMNGEAV